MPRDTDLHKAAYKGDTGIVEGLLDDGVDVNIRGAANRTPLHRAVGEGHEDIVQLLMERGANIEIRDGSGRTPMHWAAVSGSVVTARLLVEKDADVNVVTKSGSTPLHMAAEGGKLDFVEFLLEHEANIELREGVAGDGKTAYELAKEKKHKEIMQLLKPAGAGCLPGLNCTMPDWDEIKEKCNCSCLRRSR